MRLLVSGAGGFIGRALVAGLVADGHEVRPLVRDSARPGGVQLDAVTRTVVDADGADGLAGVDAVINLAGEPITAARWTPSKRERIRASRIRTTEAIARAIAKSDTPPAVLISASASGYYGNRGEELLEESSPGGVGFLAEVCRAWEAATLPARDVGVRVATIRTGIVLGAGGLLDKLEPAFRLGLGARLGSGRQWMSWISLADEVAAIRHLLDDSGCSGAFNLCAPQPVRNATFTNVLAGHLGRPTVLRIPRSLLIVALGRRSTTEVALASQRLAPTRLTEAGFNFTHRDITDALPPAPR